MANHLFCWIHIENDLLWYLKNNCNATPEDINFFVNAWKELVKNETEIDFDREWEDLKNMDKFLTRSKVLNYFSDKLIPVFKGHAAIWLLKKAKIYNADRGITNNASESMNAVLKRLKEWKQVPLDVICLSLYHLVIYYHREPFTSLDNGKSNKNLTGIPHSFQNCLLPSILKILWRKCK